MSSKARLELARQAEDENLNCTLALLHDSHSVNQCTFLYDLLARNFEGRSASEYPIILLVAAISVGRRALFVGILTLLRGHMAESLAITRRAFEYTLFASHAQITPEAAEKWLQAAQSKNKFDSYKIAFPIPKLLKKEHWNSLDEDLRGNIGELIDGYEHYSMAVHATMVAGVPKIQKTEPGYRLQFLSAYVDSEVNTDEVLRMLARMLSDHGINIRVLGMLMHRMNHSIDLGNLDFALNDFGRRLMQEVDVWQNLEKGAQQLLDES